MSSAAGSHSVEDHGDVVAPGAPGAAGAQAALQSRQGGEEAPAPTEDMIEIGGR